MWRSLFLALGVSCCILGAECLAIDKAVLATRGEAAMSGPLEISPPEWVPWSLMSAGAVVLLYSFTIPARSKD